MRTRTAAGGGVRIVVIHNGGAGGGHSPERIAAAFQAAGVEAEIRSVPPPGLRDAAVSAARGADVVVAAGGDGTVNAVASALAGTDVPLGILPAGTLNHFARDLGIPLELEAAVRVIAAGTVRRVDVGEVNGHRFLNNSSVGFYPLVVTRRGRVRTRLAKWLRLAWAALAVLWRLPRMRLRLRTELDEAPVVTPFLFVGNNRYEAAAPPQWRRPSLQGGALHVVVARWAGRLGFVRAALRTLLGREPGRDVAALEARTLRVETHRRVLRVATDGEVRRLRAPLRYSILPGALGVLAPTLAEPR